MIGKSQGGFGKVFQVRKKDTNSILAMKCMRKDCVMKVVVAIEFLHFERDNIFVNRTIFVEPKMNAIFSQVFAIRTS